MTNFQKAFYVFLSLMLAAVLVFMPEPFFRWKNIYENIPLYRFLEELYMEEKAQKDVRTYAKISERNKNYINEQTERENKKKQEELIEKENQKIKEAALVMQPQPQINLSAERLADFNYLLNEFYIVDSATATNETQLNAARFLAEDFTLEKKEEPQILIYHSHSQEAFADSRQGEIEDTIVGVGDCLTEILENTYGYQVVHVTETFDMKDGVIDRNLAYDHAREYLELFLEKHPSIEVVIDLHRDGIDEGRRLVTEINGKPTAQIMFYNGLSYTLEQGTVDYLPNPYLDKNLAFSFQLEYQAALYYPDFYRGIYLAGLRYNLHFRPCTLLLEAGAQTNTVEEVKNAMEPFADILDKVLTGQKSK